jgi:predicted aspartyl protease
MFKLGSLDFSCGRSLFRDALTEAPEPTAKIFVKINLEGRHASDGLYAQLDTGAAWSVLDPVVADGLGLLDLDGPRIRLDTRYGRLEGTLERLLVTFLADDGIALDKYGTFFISPDWPPGRTFLGYSGLLDGMRFAVDPQVNHFYFGP